MAKYGTEYKLKIVQEYLAGQRDEMVNESWTKVEEKIDTAYSILCTG